MAVRLAARRPAGLAGLALVATFLRYPPVAALLGRALARRSVVRVPPPAALLRLAVVGSEAPAALVDEVRGAIRRVSPDVMARRLRAVLAADVRAELAGTRVPVLYLGGARDRIVGRWAAAQVKAARPDAEVVMLDAPHLVLQRRARQAAGVLSAFAAG